MNDCGTRYRRHNIVQLDMEDNGNIIWKYTVEMESIDNIAKLMFLNKKVS